MSFISKEPVFFAGLVQAVCAAGLNLFVTFGLALSADQVAALNAFVLAVTAMVLSLVARSKVSPTRGGE